MHAAGAGPTRVSSVRLLISSAQWSVGVDFDWRNLASKMATPCERPINFVLRCITAAPSTCAIFLLRSLQRCEHSLTRWFRCDRTNISDPIRSDPILSDPILSDPISSDFIRSDLIRSYPIRSDRAITDGSRSFFAPEQLRESCTRLEGRVDAVLWRGMQVQSTGGTYDCSRFTRYYEMVFQRAHVTTDNV